MENYLGLIVVGLIILVFVSAFFSASETGMMAINRYRLRHLARHGNKTPQLVQRLLERPDRLLGVVLIGNTFANIFASSLATFLSLHLWGDVGLIWSSIILTFILLIFAEMTPKILAAHFPMQTAFITVWPLWLLLNILYPTIWLSNLIANTTLRLFGVKVNPRHVAEKLNTEELRTVVKESISHEETHSEILFQNKDMLLGILDLSRMRVEDVMIPRADIVGIDINDSIEEITKNLQESVHSRLPIYRGSVDHVVGVLHIKEAFKLLCKNKLNHKSIIKILREPYFIPEGTTLQQQIHEFRMHQRHLALVVDEYGDLLGLITIEDIVEEIVGHMDRSHLDIEKAITINSDESVTVDGSLSIRDLNKFLKWYLPTNGPKTISGLIIEHLENIPFPNVSVEVQGYAIEVLETKENRVIKAKISLIKKNIL